MKPDSKSTTFRGLVDELRRRCARRGVELNDGVAELILADRINAVAGLLRVSDQHAMRTCLHDDAIAGLVEVCVRARTEQWAEVELASPMLLPVAQAATVIGALAASCQAATTASGRTETTTSVVEATAAILNIAGAIARAGDTGQPILDAETVVIARNQLGAMLAHLSDGSWQMPGHRNGPDGRYHDLAMRDRIQHDLQLLQ